MLSTDALPLIERFDTLDALLETLGELDDRDVEFGGCVQVGPCVMRERRIAEILRLSRRASFLGLRVVVTTRLGPGAIELRRNRAAA